MNDDDNTLDDVISFIMRANKAELRSINDALRAAYNHTNREVSASLRVGDKVKFTSKYGEELVGHVRKINPKSVHVDVYRSDVRGGVIKWRVGPSLLTKVSQ